MLRETSHTDFQGEHDGGRRCTVLPTREKDKKDRERIIIAREIGKRTRNL